MTPKTDVGQRLYKSILGGALALWTSDEEGRAMIAEFVVAVEDEAARLDEDRLAEALCAAQEAGARLDQVAPTTAEHWHGVARRVAGEYVNPGRGRAAIAKAYPKDTR